MRKVKNEDGSETEEAEKQQYFWAMPVYNFKTENIEVWQVTQKGIRDALAALQSGEWGDPTGKFTITISKEGEGLKTKYNVTPNPIVTGKLQYSLS